MFLMEQVHGIWIILLEENRLTLLVVGPSETGEILKEKQN